MIRFLHVKRKDKPLNKPFVTNLLNYFDMTSTSRKLLNRLMAVCNSLGGNLDGTSTPEGKYRDRQQAHMKVWKVIYGVLCDSPENEQREGDLELAEAALRELEFLVNKKYTDKSGTNH